MPQKLGAWNIFPHQMVLKEFGLFYIAKMLTVFTSFLFLTTFCGLNALDLLRIMGSKLGNNLQHRRIIGGILEHKGKE